ncbi:MarR family transcriptional regulator [Amycolatopsis acidiphila]|uniref:MarR family transcriptional regulator n=1 Tax=Amycolatopsis acidiphila TaxID=715473 RepID=A0A558A469_9PSEU|nr:MarR family transcriptional regulator [Amycolatopsis acidiphila]TVT19050.1 MarR family transcriptional regulator [Amycolatopsis acidiphila]UIJ63709.1 MarR family transcriptional regulator [Amycolatopsis acidiphila]
MTTNPAVPVTDSGELAARLFVSIGRLTRSVRRQEPAVLTHGEISALITLVRSGPLRLSDLAGKEGVTSPSMSRIVTDLTEKGFVRRERVAADRRASLVIVTDAGASIAGDAWLTVAEELRRRVDLLGDAERAAMRAALPALEQLTGRG